MTSKMETPAEVVDGYGMVVKRTCKFVKEDNQPCQASPLTGSEYCFMHDPAMAEERDQARWLGGLRRRREKATSEVYDWAGLDDVGEIRRVLQIAVADSLGLENSPARSRTLGYLASLSLKALEISELEKRVSALEGLLFKRKPLPSRSGKRGR